MLAYTPLSLAPVAPISYWLSLADWIVISAFISILSFKLTGPLKITVPVLVKVLVFVIVLDAVTLAETFDLSKTAGIISAGISVPSSVIMLEGILGILSIKNIPDVILLVASEGILSS